jgi:hypothetical protein
MAVVVTHSTPSDGTFSAEGALAWDANHSISGLPTVVEVEVDFGTNPRWDQKFTITDAAISADSKIIAVQSGKTATGRRPGDAQWDSINCAILPGVGQATLFCTASPGPVVGKRIIQYEVM